MCTANSWEKRKVLSTLMSGWRLTSFMNTVLNRVYLEMAGIGTLSNYALHNGDDVFAVCDEWTQVRGLLSNTETLGLRAQMTKQAIGTIGEFLRVDNLAERVDMSQYLTRSCATAVHARINTEAARSFTDLVDANDERMEALKLRGGNSEPVEEILRQLDRNMCRQFGVEQHQLNLYRKLHPVQGGKNTEADASEGVIVFSQNSTTLEGATEGSRAMMPGTVDYLKQLCAECGVKFGEKIAKKAGALAMRMFTTNRPTVSVIRADTVADKMAIAIYGCHKKQSIAVNFAKARLLRSEGILALGRQGNAMTEYLRRHKDPVRFMSLVV